MITFQVEGTYRADRGHEHGTPKPHIFNFTVCVENSDEMYKTVESELRRLDEKFDSIRTLHSVRVETPAPKEQTEIE